MVKNVAVMKSDAYDMHVYVAKRYWLNNKNEYYWPDDDI